MHIRRAGRVHNNIRSLQGHGAYPKLQRNNVLTITSAHTCSGTLLEGVLAEVVSVELLKMIWAVFPSTHRSREPA